MTINHSLVADAKGQRSFSVAPQQVGNEYSAPHNSLVGLTIGMRIMIWRCYPKEDLQK